MILRAIDLGQTVASSFNTPTLFQIANDLTKMQIDSSVAEADVGGIVEGQDVDFTVDAYPYRNFHGGVTQVRNSPTTVNNVVTYDCVIGVTNDDYKLKPGMTANVSVIVAQRSDVVIIPNSALRLSGCLTCCLRRRLEIQIRQARQIQRKSRKEQTATITAARIGRDGAAVATASAIAENGK